MGWGERMLPFSNKDLNLKARLACLSIELIEKLENKNLTFTNFGKGFKTPGFFLN